MKKNASVAMLLGLAGAASSALAAPFDCLVEPAQVVEIRTPVEGLIDKVHVQRGDSVIMVDNLSNAHPNVLERIERITGKQPTFYDYDVRDVWCKAF